MILDETLDGLQAPTADLSGFTEHALRKGSFVYRAHPANRRPLWFESNEHSRFNLPLPNGTCYMSKDPSTAIEGMLIGFAGKGRNISEAHVDGFAVTRMMITRSYRLANISTAKAKSFGVRTELSRSVSMHRTTKLWASSFAAAGFLGISYTHRFSAPGTARANAIALFGHAGDHKYEASPEDARLNARDLAEAAGFTIVPIPLRSHLTMI